MIFFGHLTDIGIIVTTVEHSILIYKVAGIYILLVLPHFLAVAPLSIPSIIIVFNVYTRLAIPNEYFVIPIARIYVYFTHVNFYDVMLPQDVDDPFKPIYSYPVWVPHYV